MKRNIRFLALLLIAPTCFAFLAVFIAALIAGDVDESSIWDRASFYVSGLVVGAWIYGIRE